MFDLPRLRRTYAAAKAAHEAQLKRAAEAAAACDPSRPDADSRLAEDRHDVWLREHVLAQRAGSIYIEAKRALAAALPEGEVLP